MGSPVDFKDFTGYFIIFVIAVLAIAAVFRIGFLTPIVTGVPKTVAR